LGEFLSIDETALSNGELYTIVTNKEAKGKKGSLVAIIEGTKSSNIIKILKKIPQEKREAVKEVTLDMSNAMDMIIRFAFPNAKIVIDRFHTQQLVTEAVQDIRVDFRREAMKEENEALKKAREEKKKFKPLRYENEETKKQLLARGRYLLFKPKSKWTINQKQRAVILFREFPELEKAYELSMMFRACYENCKSIEDGKRSLDNWFKKVEEKKIESFLVPAETIRLHQMNILNYFVNRSTNASAESFNAKIKGFRSLLRGVNDKTFFLFRVSKLYA